MDEELLDILVDPVSKTPLTLDASANALVGGDGRTYPIDGGVPRFIVDSTDDQVQTSDSFDYKWHQEHTVSSTAWHDFVDEWAPRRYGFASRDEMRDWFSARGRTLDAGCGSGFGSSAYLSESFGGEMWVGVDISRAVDIAARRFASVPRAHFLQADALRLPFRDGTFDTAISDGVLHHTPSTRDALASVTAALVPGGEILFYVYLRKAPLREFADDYVRDLVSALPPDEAWELLKPLTRLGQALAELHTEVDVPEDVDVLGIKAGRYDVQRLVYWSFAKMFWNDAFTFDENHVVNFDWYHPRYSHRQTEEDVRRWCDEIGLDIVHAHVEESGISVRARKR